MSSNSPRPNVDAVTHSGNLQQQSQGLSDLATAEDLAKVMTLLGRRVGGDKHMRATLTPATNGNHYKLQFSSSVPKAYLNSIMLDKVNECLPDKKSFHYNKRFAPALKTSDEGCYISGLTRSQLITVANTLAANADRKAAEETAAKDKKNGWDSTKHYTPKTLLAQIAEIEADRIARTTPCTGLNPYKISPSQLKIALDIIESPVTELHGYDHNTTKIAIPEAAAGHSFAIDLLANYTYHERAADPKAVPPVEAAYEILIPTKELVSAVNDYVEHHTTSMAMLNQLQTVNTHSGHGKRL